MKKIIVSKFGGTSMANADSINQSSLIAKKYHSSVLVVSAIAGVTDILEELFRSLTNDDKSAIKNIILKLIEVHIKIARQLGAKPDDLAKINSLFSKLEIICSDNKKNTGEAQLKDEIMSYGEYASTILMEIALKTNGIKYAVVDAKRLINTDGHFGNATPDTSSIRSNCIELTKFIEGDIVVLTQGYVASTDYGLTTTLGRGGSDYTASLIAEAIQADELQIWTDTAGIYSADPKIIDRPKQIKFLSFQEAAELATAGAKILFPKTIVPCRRANIPVFVGNTFDPDSGGTKIINKAEQLSRVRALAIKTNQSMLSITTPEMSHQPGFLANFFSIFAKHKISIDQVSTSEITVSVIIEDSVSRHAKLFSALKEIGEINLETGLCVISIIGNKVNNSPGLTREIFVTLEGKSDKIPIRMICQGASQHNFCFIVEDRYGMSILKRLHREFIED